MRQLLTAVDTERRMVRFDPDLSDDDLLRLMDDELSGCPPSDSDHAAQFDDYCSRLHRFVSHLDYVIRQ